MQAHVAALYRHPVKGFTPEAVISAELRVGQRFPFDRLYAVENGPSGFDPAAPKFIPKQKFTVLMTMPGVARARTRYSEVDGVLHAEADGAPAISVDLGDGAGRTAFAHWLAGVLGGEATGALRVIEAPSAWRFTDHPAGHVSIINLASLRDLETRLGRPIDPLRFRANIYVDGWPAWAENDWEGRDLMLGWARARMFKPIVRCAATHVNPATAERDMDVVKALFDNYGHLNCGVYVRIEADGRIGLGDACAGPVEAAWPDGAPT